MFNSYFYIITGEKMNLDERLEELDRYIKYVESVLKEKQDERFCLIAEKKQQKDEKKHI
jgi:hypothetical protein